MISFETARDLAYAYREVETADKLLEQLAEAKKWHKPPDVRDAFGRRQDGLQLGVPSGDNSQRMYNVAWELAVPIVEAHRAASQAKITALCQKAMAEMHTPQAQS